MLEWWIVVAGLCEAGVSELRRQGRIVEWSSIVLDIDMQPEN